MTAKYIRLYPENPETRKLEQIAGILKNGGVIIFPTDTIYGIGCEMTNKKAVERVCRIKGIDPAKSQLSIICKDISQVSTFVRGLETRVFKVLKKNLPGPFTFIFKCNNHLPKKLSNRKGTIGIRIPDHSIPILLVEELSGPLLTTSVKDEDEIIGYTTDPDQIFEKFSEEVDLIIDAGPGKNTPSTVVDVSSGEFRLVRQGLGNFDNLI